MALFRILLDVLPAPGALVSVPPEQAHHLVHVRRLRADARIECIDRNGRIASARVVATTPTVTVQLIEQAVQTAVPFVLTLLPAVLPEKAFDVMLQKCTELGVDECQPIITARTIVARASLTPARCARWQRICDDAARQCGGPPMRVAAPLPFAQAMALDRQSRLIADRMGCRLHECLARTAEDAAPLAAAIAIGPEGGFTPSELATAQAAGWRTVHLHERVLRAETAAITAAAAIHTLLQNYRAS